MKKLIISFGLLGICILANAQDTLNKVKLNVGMDLVSRFVWRGTMYSDAPNLQPSATVSYGQFSLMNWNSYSVNKNYAEIDFYLTWQPNRFGITISDYCNLKEPANGYHYFDFKNKTTTHTIESAVFYTLSDRFPLKLYGGIFFYGMDKNSEGNNNYSTYLEVSYPLHYAGYTMNFLAAGTTKKGFYGTEASLVNVGISIRRDIKITSDFTIPLTLSLVANPNANYAWGIVALTF